MSFFNLFFAFIGAVCFLPMPFGITYSKRLILGVLFAGAFCDLFSLPNHVELFFSFMGGLFVNFCLIIPWQLAQACGAFADFSRNVTAAGNFDPLSLEPKSELERLFSSLASILFIKLLYLEALVTKLLCLDLVSHSYLKIDSLANQLIDSSALFLLITIFFLFIEQIQFYLNRLLTTFSFQVELGLLKIILALQLWRLLPYWPSFTQLI